MSKKYDAQGALIEKDNSENDENTQEMGGDFVDSMIANLLTEEEKASIKNTPPQEDDEEEEENPDSSQTTQDTDETDKGKTTVEFDPEVELKDKVFKVDGNELTYEELKKGYLRQSDYTRKTQQLATERQKMAPFQVLNDYLARNPQDFQRVVGLLKEKTKQERPEDPIEALSFDAAQNALNAIQKPIEGVSNEVAEVRKAQKILEVKQAIATDPLVGHVQQAMHNYVWGDYQDIHGPEAAQEYFTRLDNEPMEYGKLYLSIRKRVEAQIAAQQRNVDNTPPDKAGKNKKKKPPVVEKGTPFVADADTTVPTVNKEKLKRKELRVLQERTRGGKTEDVVAFIEASGMLDHLS